ncbi:alpha/beta fold hydrolase [Actinomycetospora cinnamomea]|uniref:Pimeloyl-ACP methyl ester carboxylesterase n=1 Tax=Actinomycetospora cinnamomea TaxID=663609 RepID=A0A2U1FL25_9PSEU|nr:alpha/beta hydrolase [Actinomycetospora cinnamomea]PVZ12915.1 pimeloyl-ACP methyl ester carboxylesterase [Actinomycetospora cinnamomea]
MAVLPTERAGATPGVPGTSAPAPASAHQRPRPRPVHGVRTSDGVPLHVEIRGHQGPTVVLTHGFTVDSTEWSPQVAALAHRARVVTWDQRGHGRSGWGDPRRATIDQLGRDLAAVVEAVAPCGRVVLGGHSMGGMSVLALARRHPEWFGTRVGGVFLVATSAGDLVSDGLLGVLHATARRAGVLPAVLQGARLAAPLADQLPWRDSLLGRWLVRRLAFTPDATDDEVRRLQTVTESVPLPVTSAFSSTLLDHDETDALPALARIPTTVVAATDDRLTPAAHGRRIAETLGPRARLVLVDGAGHAVNQTHHAVVDAALLDLVDRLRHR